MRRSLLACSAGGLSSLALVVFASCGGEEERARPAAEDAGSDTALVGNEAAPPEPDAEPPPGDVCGIRSGLQASAAWPLRGGCTTRAGWSALAGPTSALVSFSVAAPVGESSPAVSASGVTWVGATDGHVLAITNAGTVRWAHRTGAAVSSSPAIDIAGNAIVGSGDGFLYALAAEDGPRDADAGADDAGVEYPPAKVVFALQVGPIASSPVIGGDGKIYVGTTEGKLVAVDRDGARLAWTSTTNDTRGSSPALGQDGTIYVGSTDRKLYALSPAGATKWALDLGSPVHGSPAVGGDGTVYVGTADGKLHAVGPGGAARWSYATGGAITGTPAVYAGAVYVGSEDKSLHAVSTVDGKARWTYATLGAVGTPVIGPDGTVYVGATDARVYAITSTGELFYAVNVRGSVKTAPAIGVGPALYVATDNALVVLSP
ncbi:MAG: PQQ-binding-like beta-propeller repeat protein [Labilithrix sp.]|nr:PQQ-binding-like beta-propeller repeat protein [Labilithrix sp.]